MNRLETSLCGLTLKNPVLTASGTFGSGQEFMPFYHVGLLGGISVKGTTLLDKKGNPPGRVVETPGGLLNCIGLQNKGVDHFIQSILPEIKDYGTEIIVNISGNNVEEYGLMAEKLNIPGVSALEVNISCPNVKHGGLAFGTVPEDAAEVTRKVKEISEKPCIVKLSPNVTDITAIAKAVEEAGADGISMINTLLGMAIDIDKQKPLLSNVFAGLSGPCVKPVGLRMVWQVYEAVKIPIMGMGGIMNWQDALEYILAGATAIQVGTANLINPTAAKEIVEGLEKYCMEKNIKNINELVGKAHK